MANDPHYFGESLGCQTCVEDRRTNSVRFANRHVPYEWAFAHTSNKMSIPITPEAVAEFLSGYADGYTNEMREEEFDDGNNKGI